MKLLVALLAASTLIAAPEVASYEGDNSMPAPLRKVGIDQRLNQQVPLDITLTNEHGETKTIAQFMRPGKPVILALVYYQCQMLCTLELNGLLRTMRAMELTAGKEFDVMTVSFDPAETPEMAAAKKQSYLEKYQRPDAENGWHFYTGKEDQIKRLTEAVGFRYVRDPATGDWAHASGVMIMTPGGKLSRYFYGVEYATRDIRLGLVEATSGKIGTMNDQVLLFCYHYDPATGKYGMAIMTAIRAGGILTVLAILTFWGLMFRRGRRRKYSDVDRLPVIS